MLSIAQATAELSQKTGHSPTIAELATHLEISEDEVIEGLEGAQAYSTSSLDAPLGDDAQWQLLAHLGLAARGLHEPAALRALLALLNAPARLHSALGRGNARQIDAIREVERSLVTRVHRGVPLRTLRSHVVLDDAAFPSSGHAFLFTALLDQLFAGAAPFLTASELHAVLHPSAAEHRWPPRLAL